MNKLIIFLPCKISDMNQQKKIEEIHAKQYLMSNKNNGGKTSTIQARSYVCLSTNDLVHYNLTKLLQIKLCPRPSAIRTA